MHNDTYPPLWYHTEYFTTLTIPCAPHIHPSLQTPNLWQSLYCLHSFVFSRMSTVGIIQYATFSDWFLSLSNIHLNFLHAFSWLNSSLLCTAEYYSIVWMDHNLFIHLPMERHLGWFQCLGIIKRKKKKDCFKHSCSGFCVNIIFQLISVNT